MATVVDSLVVTLSIDSTGFDKGFRDAIDALNRVKVEQVKIGAAIEESGKRVAGTFTQIRNEALALFAVLLGAHGLKDFTTGLMESNVQLGRLATNLGAAPQWLSAWGMLAERAGGSTEQTAASFERIAKTLYELRNSGGGIPREVLMMQNLATTKIDWEHGPVKYFETMARVIQEANKVNPGDTYFFAKAAGFDDATYNAIIRADKALTGLIASKEKLAWSDAALTQAGKMTDAFFDLRQELSSLAGTIVEEAGPAIVDLLKWLDEMVRSNSTDIKGGIVQGVRDFSGWIKTIRWDDVKNTFHDIAKGANDIANALGGVVRVSEVLIGLWAGAKVVNAGRAIGSLIGAGLGVAGAAGSAFTWLTGLGGGTAAASGGGAAAGAAAGGIGVLSRMFALTAPLLLGGDTATPDPTDTDRKKAKAAEDAYTKEHGSFWHQMGSYFGISAGASEATGPRTDMPAGFNQGGQFGRTPPGGYNASQFLDLTVEGRTISRANPLPVMLTGPGASGPQSLWEWLFGKSDGSGSGGGGSGSTGSGDGRTWVQKLFGIGGATHHGASSTLRARGTHGGVTGPGGGAIGWWTPDRMKEASDYLVKNAGLSEMGAAGLVARWAAVESSGGPGSVNPRSGAKGIGQWLGSRAPNTPSDFQGQLKKAADELNGSESSAGDVLRRAQTAADAARGASMFERAEGYNPLTGADNFTGSTPSQRVYNTIHAPRGGGDVFIGDSIARGLADAAHARSSAVVGAQPDKNWPGRPSALKQIQDASAGYLAGKRIILSGGASNDPMRVGALANELAALRDKGVDLSNVRVMGVGDRSDFGGINKQLEKIAGDYGAIFVPLGATPGGVHPGDYPGLLKGIPGLRGGGAGGAHIPNGPALSSITNNKPVTTSSTSNAMHIGEMNINAPNATDSTGIAKTIGMALSDYGFVALNDAGTF